jgi:outer membrane protein OmpA-like peptidoglycan-associated protein
MNKSLLMAIFLLSTPMQAPQVSYSQESNAKVCIGDCMLIWPEEEKPSIPPYFLSDIFFDTDRYNLDSFDKLYLKTHENYLRAYENVHLEIQGHCDERGGNDENIILGEKRAATVKTYLVSRGIDSRRLHIISYGEEKPFCIESNEECWKLNNRVHFMVAVKND